MNASRRERQRERERANERGRERTESRQGPRALSRVPRLRLPFFFSLSFLPPLVRCVPEVDADGAVKVLVEAHGCKGERSRTRGRGRGRREREKKVRGKKAGSHVAPPALSHVHVGAARGALLFRTCGTCALNQDAVGAGVRGGGAAVLRAAGGERVPLLPGAWGEQVLPRAAPQGHTRRRCVPQSERARGRAREGAREGTRGRGRAREGRAVEGDRTRGKERERKRGGDGSQLVAQLAS